MWVICILVQYSHSFTSVFILLFLNQEKWFQSFPPCIDSSTLCNIKKSVYQVTDFYLRISILLEFQYFRWSFMKMPQCISSTHFMFLKKSGFHWFLTIVSFGVSLHQIVDLDEKNQILTTSCWLTQVSPGAKIILLNP